MAEDTAIATTNNILTMPAGAMVTSLKAEPGDREAATKLFNAMNNPGHKISDMINKRIAVRDFLMEMTEVANEETGEVSTVPRCVFIDDKGESYQAVSLGMANVLRNMVAAFGPAPWEPAITIEIKQQKVKRGSMLTADVVM